jgi:hypothetical protein
MSAVLDLLKTIVKSMDRSKVVEDCLQLLEGFKGKVEKIDAMKKKIKQGDRACIEVL